MEVISIAAKSAEWTGQTLPEPVFERTQSMLKTLFECQGAVGDVADCLAGLVQHETMLHRFAGRQEGVVILPGLLLDCTATETLGVQHVQRVQAASPNDADFPAQI